MSLELQGLTKRFGTITAVDDVWLSLAEGETVALLGPSGCGKSTLLRLVAGLERPDTGRLLLGGADVTSLPPQKRDVGMVFQAFALFPHLNVARNVAFGLVEAGVPAAARAARVEELLRMVGLHGLGERRVDRLSGGQQQRVALARALAPNPGLLLLDEPLSNLDEQLRQALKVELAGLLGALGKRALYVTHDQAEAFALAHRVALMRAGRLIQLGTPEELLERPASGWAARFLGHENVYEAGPHMNLPVGRGAREALFRADLAELWPAATRAVSPAHPYRVEAELLEAVREGLGWRLLLQVPTWGVQVVWRGFDRELTGLTPGGAGFQTALEPARSEGDRSTNVRLLLTAPVEAWQELPGEGVVGRSRGGRHT